jgi:hypothetical protein
MGYWKREYTERKGGKPLFRPEPKSAEEEVPPQDPADDCAGSEPVENPPTKPSEAPAGTPR